MDITHNKVDETALPISVNRVSANEYNQIAGSLMHIINTSGLTPDSQNNAQLLTALQSILTPSAYITEIYHNGSDYYRVWSDGFCEQGGSVYIAASSYADIPLLKAYNNADYLLFQSHTDLGTGGQAESYIRQSGGTTIRIGNACGNAQTFYWHAKGYITSAN